MNYAAMHSIATVAAFLAFISICWWAYRPANRERFEADGRLPLDTDPIFTSGKNIATPSSTKEKAE